VHAVAITVSLFSRNISAKLVYFQEIQQPMFISMKI